MKRVLMVAALVLLCWIGFGAHAASWAVPKEPTQSAESEKLRTLQPGTKLTLHLLDGSKIEGVLREVRADSVVLQQKHGKSTTVMLADVKGLETKSGGLHPVTRVLIIVGATVGALFVVAVATC